MKPELIIRPAHPGDAKLAARLIQMAMGRFGEYIFGNGSLAKTLEVLEQLFIAGKHRFSYEHTFLAEEEGIVAGLLLSHPAKNMSHLDMLTAAPLLTVLGFGELLNLSIRMLPLAGGREAERDEYYISDLAVFPDFQGQGIGTRLLAFAEDQAAKHGLRKCSLIVALGNAAARRLYLQVGYHIVETVSYSHLQKRSGETGYERMRKMIA